jgi:hypothetical protein
MSRNQHVVPRDGRWAIRGAGNRRATRVFATQAEAIKAAREIARKQGTDLVIHRADGRIRQKNSYGNRRARRFGITAQLNAVYAAEPSGLATAFQCAQARAIGTD